MSPDEDLAAWAVELGRSHISEELPARWAHDEGVIAKAREVAHLVGADADLLVAAAAVHDIGHAAAGRNTGFQPLDSARLLQRLGAPKRLVDLVACNACGWIEAELRGLGDDYAELSDEGGPTRDALWWCCLTTSASGGPTTLDGRAAGWASAYADDPIIAQWFARAEPELRAAIGRTESRLRVGATP